MSAMTERGALDAAIAKLQSDNARLRAALIDARDALRNDFEPDNQSAAWHRTNDVLEKT